MIIQPLVIVALGNFGIKDGRIFERTGSPSLLIGGTSMNLKRVSSK